MLDAIGGFGTFLFFGIINLCFFPFIILYYVETKGRTLEEIDIIFAKGYTNKEWYVSVGNHMPRLSSLEVESEAIKWGLTEVGAKPIHAPSVREEPEKRESA